MAMTMYMQSVWRRGCLCFGERGKPLVEGAFIQNGLYCEFNLEFYIVKHLESETALRNEAI